MSIPRASHRLVADSFLVDQVVRHFAHAGPGWLRESFNLPKLPKGLVESEFRVRHARDKMAEFYQRKCHARQTLLKALSKIRQTLRRVYREQPEVLEFLGVPRRGRPRKGEVRPVKPSAQGDGDVLDEAWRLIEQIKTDESVMIVLLCEERCKGMEQIGFNMQWYEEMIRLHERAKVLWHEAIARRNEIKAALKRWMHEGRMWVTHEAMKDPFWSRFLVSWRPQVFDNRFLTKEAAHRMRRVLYQRAWRKRKREEAESRKREAREALARRARDAVALLA